MQPESKGSKILLRVVWVLLLLGWGYAGWLYTQQDGNEDKSDASRGSIDAALAALKSRLDADPQNFDGWLLMGRSYLSVGRGEEAIAAFERAYNLTNGESIEATLNLAESLIARDPNSLAGSAGALFERSLSKLPDHPKALWYGAHAALERGDLVLGRDRLRKVLEHSPPAELRLRIEEKISSIDQHLQNGSAEAARRMTAVERNAPLTHNRTLLLNIRVAEPIRRQQTQLLTMFVLAYDLNSGKRVAIQRRSSIEAPLTVQLTVQDAAARESLDNPQRYQVVALMSSTDNPTLRPGDFYGVATYDAAKAVDPVQIIIDRRR